MNHRVRMPIIVGPTAGGKTALAVRVAHLCARNHGQPGEVISADSVQIYRGLDIGSAKPTVAEQDGVPHHLIDIVEPNQPFTVHDWLRAAERKIEEIRSKGNTPIIAGGTHLYIKALLDGLFDGPEQDRALRDSLMAQPLADLRNRLQEVDPAACERIHPNDRRRTVRALEVFELTGTPISDLQKQWDSDRPRNDDRRVFGLRWSTEAINSRINHRVREMMAAGLEGEVGRLRPNLGPQAAEALGYKQIIAVFNNQTTLENAVERIKIDTRRFAKNQRTWLKRLALDPRFSWVDMDDADLLGSAQVIVDKCLMFE